ncbi:hypothetical protein [Methylobacillus glycogenes]|uniref:hypothetical protein n=1 Tax=Methylobacillus glycogenes TaxID=406 RepID=UPI000B29F60D|nr:hypothetical protein [Methylobacillus glycogenes]
MLQAMFWMLVLPAAATLAITMGIRQSMGLFVSPLNTSTGLGIVSISLAMAIGQFSWGLAQPLFGMLADRIGASRSLFWARCCWRQAWPSLPSCTLKWA